MYKKPTQPPTPSVNNSKKGTKVNERVATGTNDKKNDTSHNEFKNKDEQLLVIVKEYLQMNGYTRTYDVIKNEKPNLRAKVQINQPQHRNEIDKNHILQCFDKGSREEFFKLTAKMLTSNQQHIKKMQFELNIYFCIYNIHPNLKKQATIDRASSEAFKKYLDTKGADLSGTSQFLSFFALPFMQKPQQHGALSHVFTKEWLNKIRAKLVQFLSTYLRSSNSFNQNSSNTKKVSTLQELYYHSLNNSTNTSREECKENCNHLIDIENLKKENRQLREVIDNYQNKFQEFAESSKQNLIESNQKWFYFSREIFTFARKYAREDKVKLLDKYNSFFGGNIDEHIEANQISLFDKNSYMNEDLSIAPDFSKQKIAMKKPENVANQQNYQIDLSKIRTLFLQSNLKDKETEICIVLKALKDRFNKKTSYSQKRETIIEYSRGDICGVNQENYIIQKKLLFDGNDKIREFYVKLMEVITTDAFGLQYLTRSKKLIENLVGIFNIESEFSKCRKPILGILQRLSFSKEPRMQMIKLGIIPIIFNIFRNQKSELSSFTIQFLIALMMNLSLKKESRPDFEKHKKELITIIIEQMGSENTQIRNYVNGTTFLLLTSKEIKAEALKQKLDEVVKNLLEDKQDQMCSQQYHYILNRLTGEQDEDIGRDSDSEEDEEEEAETEEFEEQEYEQQSESSSDEYIEGDCQIANGEQLLMKNYALLGPEAMREQILTRSVLDESSKRLNNMTTSINRSRRLDNIFVQKGNATVLEPELDHLLNRKKG